MPTMQHPIYSASISLSSADQYNASYTELFRLTGARFITYYDHLSSRSVGDSVAQLAPTAGMLLHHSPHFVRDIGVAILVAAALTLFRLFLDRVMITKMLKLGLLDKRNGTRFGESLYSLIFYGVAFLLSSYIERENQFLSHPERLWTDFSLKNQIPVAVRVLYTLEMAHYLHCMYAVLFINKWSKDSAVLFFHHIVALLLLSISFLTKTYRVGVLVLYLHDVCDVIMEGCKCLIKLQLKNWFLVKLSEVARVVGFLAFMLFWFVFRLYLFPLCVIYPSVMYLTTTPVNSWVPLMFGLYFLLWFIFAMNIYWASLIFKVFINALRGGHEEIDDIREIDDEANGELPNGQLKTTKSE